MKSIVDYTNKLKEFFASKQALTAESNARAKLGAHNLLETSMAVIKANNTNGSWSGNAYSINGLIFTFNNDLSVSISGTSNASGNIDISATRANVYNGCKLSGCPTGGSNATYYLAFVDSTASVLEYEFGNGLTINAANGHNSRVIFHYESAQNLSGKTIKPMITLASDPYTEYTPFAKTNFDLTNDMVEPTTFGIVEKGTTASKKYYANEHFYRDGKFCTALIDISSGATLTKNTNYKEGNVADVFYDEQIGILSSTSVWSGNTLTFPIVLSNTRLYRLEALDALGSKVVNCLFINRATGLVYKNIATDTVAATYSNGNLVVTLPQNTYWIYKFELIKTVEV